MMFGGNMKEYEYNGKKVLVADHKLSEEELRRFKGDSLVFLRGKM